MGSTLLTVSPVAPTSLSHDGSVGQWVWGNLLDDETFSFTGGSGLKLASGGDSAKLVAPNVACGSGAAAIGTSEVTDLGPDNTDGAMEATITLTLQTGGDYKVCYRLAGGTYTQVGSNMLWAGPTGFNDDGFVTVGKQEIITITGGSGFNRTGSDGDGVIMVPSSNTCSGRQGEVIGQHFLGPDDADGLTSDRSTNNFTVELVGSYKVCYKIAGAVNFVQVGSTLVTVYGLAPTSFFGDGSVVTGGTEIITLVGGMMHGVMTLPAL